MCVLLKHCRQDEYCYPGQRTIADTLGYSPRYIRNLVSELESQHLVSKKRRGFNKTNTYRVIKDLTLDGNSTSPHLRTKYPLNQGNQFPTNINYRIGKSNIKGMKSLREALIKIGVKQKID
ncbi:helix-turn-helix domain-containing protein [Candidatus Collierbacteria bacterium]|nr:helix-turn-helix domain-containing protein [Candidatus Collierbacteria bacterium]